MSGLFWIAVIAALYQIIKEALEKPAPPNQRFDRDKYWKDIQNPNLSMMEIVKRRGKGYYNTTAPKNTKNN